MPLNVSVQAQVLLLKLAKYIGVFGRYSNSVKYCDAKLKFRSKLETAWYCVHAVRAGHFFVNVC